MYGDLKISCQLWHKIIHFATHNLAVLGPHRLEHLQIHLLPLTIADSALVQAQETRLGICAQLTL